MDNQRIALWDNLKFFLIFLVVLGHLTLQYFYSSQMFGTMSMVIYSFHMPAFVFVSGLFSKRSINSEKPPLKKAFIFLVICYFVRILTFASNIIFGVRSGFDIFSMSDIPWYMMAMAIWYMLVWALKKTDAKYILIISVTLALFAGYMKGKTDFLCVLRVITFFPFFYAGYIADRKKLEDFTAKKWVRICSGIYFAAFVAVMTLTFKASNVLFPLLSGRRKYTSLGELANFGVPLRLAYYIVVSLLIIAVISLCPRKKCIFTTGGQRTMQIFVFHRPILYILKNAGFFWLIRQVGEGWEWLALVVVITITALLCLKFWSKPLEWLMKPGERDYGAS